MGREGRYEIKTGTDDGRIYADIFRNGRHWRRVTSDGTAPFDSEADARAYARRVVKRQA